jgi:hypothetical protein
MLQRTLLASDKKVEKVSVQDNGVGSVALSCEPAHKRAGVGGLQVE